MKKCFWMLLLCLLLACSCALAECALCGGDSVCDTCAGNGYVLMQAYGSTEEVKVACPAGCDNGRCPDCAVPCDVCSSDGKCDTCGGNGYVLMLSYDTREEVKIACPGENCAVGQCTACMQAEEPVAAEGGYAFADAAMEKVVRGLMGWEDKTITREDLLSITKLDMFEYDEWKVMEEIRSLEDLVQMENLVELDMTGLSVTNEMLVDIAKLSSLEYLNLCEQVLIDDISPLASLTELRELSIATCWAPDLTPLSSLTKLERLIADYCGISDIAPLSKLTALRVLSLDGNDIEDVKPLTKLKNLKYLYLLENPIRNANALNGLKKQLEELYLD